MKHLLKKAENKWYRDRLVVGEHKFISIISVGLLIGLFLSQKLWITNRLLPLTPALPINQPFGSFLLILLAAFLTASLISLKKRNWLTLCLVVLYILFLLDQNRLQPWAYQYCVMLTLITLQYKKTQNKTYLSTLQIVFASIYFWSGLQKVNTGFITNVVPWFLSAWKVQLSLSNYIIIGNLMAVTEIFMGVGLLHRKTKDISLYFIIAMHIFIVITLGPWGLNHNSVVWPWNLVMIALAMLLFKNNHFEVKKTFTLTKLELILVTAYITLPALHNLGLTDSYLSHALYSGNIHSAHINYQIFPSYFAHNQSLLKEIETNNKQISLQQWSFTELNVPIYPQERIFRSIAKTLCRLEEYPQKSRTKDTKKGYFIA